MIPRNSEVFKQWREASRRRYLANWPENAPALVAHLSIEEARECLAAADAAEGMPDAELTPELVFLRKAGWESEEEG
jgi:hypothetical protein